jgi:CRP-like cAMP-binding protein
MASPDPPLALRNRLLAALPPDAWQQLQSKLNPVPLTSRQILYATDDPIAAVYFPEAGMVSMVVVLADGLQAEVGIVGREGMVGLPLVFGVETTFTETMVQIPGQALGMEARAFHQELEANAALRRLLLRYSEALQAQIAQTAACNGRHDLEQRLARWLLMARDRVDDDELPLTQDFLAMMLGVHRPSISVTAGILQRAGLIRYRNGRITILDRNSLKAAACECYGMVQHRHAALLGQLNS